MDIKQLQDNCELLNVRLFCEKYDIVYDSLVRVLREERELSDKFANLLQIAFEKYKDSIH